MSDGVKYHVADIPEDLALAQKILERAEEAYGQQFDHGDRNLAGRINDLIKLAKAALRCKPQVPAEVIESARIRARILREQGFHFAADDIDDLLACVEAGNARTPVPPEKLQALEEATDEPQSDSH